MARYAIFTVTLNKAATSTVTVNYTTQDGTATSAAGDYTPKSGTLTFAPGETEKTVSVTVRDTDSGKQAGEFTLKLSSPTNGALGDGSGLCTLPGASVSTAKYVERFNQLYAALHNNQNGYFGPQTGANAFAVPRHIPEIDPDIINEAPDYGGETVSETASFWVGLEAMKGALSSDWTGYTNAWDKIDQFYVPSATNQPVASYNNARPADYIPEQNLPSLYPPATDLNAPVGVDPLAQELETTYGNKRLYLMHWIIDVEGKYGFRNGDGSTTITYMNTYQRGMQESSYETIPQACWDDFQNGGSARGFQPLFTQGKPDYPSAPFDYGKKWSYTNAPDAEARAIQWSFRAMKWAQAGGSASAVATATTRAKKMGDYLRYNLFDKYFRQIGNNSQGSTWADSYSACHFLINWYASWGGEIPASGQQGTWSYRIGCSEAHHGYQGPDTAYALATDGGGMTPQSPSAGDIWKVSVYRQIEMIRWLQSPEGPIAGGVTNSFNARYETPTDGRQSATFYGMHYVYSPVWHDPVSNNWVGFQAWGHGRTAHLFYEVADKTNTLATDIRPNLEIILDRLVAWFLKETQLTADGSFTIPTTLSWASETAIPGQTTTAPNNEGVYEFLPSTSWGKTSTDYASFWSASSVPNPNLHCTITERGIDLGVASSTAVMLLFYAKAKQIMGKFDTTIPNSTFKPSDAYALAKEIIDRIWTKFWDGQGIARDEPRSDYSRMKDAVYVPSTYTGAMPNGDAINQTSTFVSIRSFLTSDPKWSEVEAYASGSGPVPVFKYHRFWAQAEYAIACGMLHTYFAELAED